MKAKRIGSALASALVAAACATAPSGAAPTALPKGDTYEAVDLDPNGGADGLRGANDHADSKYFAHPDFYRMKSAGDLVILEGFKTMQQTTEWSCAPSSVVMALRYLGIEGVDEWTAAVGMRANADEDVPGALPGSADSWYEPGANIGKVVSYLRTIPGVEVVEANYKDGYGESDLVGDAEVASLAYSPAMKGNFKKYFNSVSLYAAENDPATGAWVADAADSYFVKWLTGHLRAGRPIIAHTNLYNGHYVVVIGYDGMGTPGIGDDVLIFADPYDTWDHWQDGYVAEPLEKFFYEWNDFNIAAKPFQLQPFVVVGAAR